jgi:trans-aconitate methyltransferase
VGIKHQEFQFVNWSRDVSQHTYDVARIIEHLSRLDERALRIADIGGGIGSVAQAIATSVPRVSVDVFDSSKLAKMQFIRHERVRLRFGDFLESEIVEKYDVVLLRTVLHHITGATTQQTRRRQQDAISKAAQMLHDTGSMFVTENFYESVFASDLTGELIYQLTKLKSAARLFRALGANTAGEGVRFRSYRSWSEMFAASKLRIRDDIDVLAWSMPLWQRLPLLCAKRYQAMLTLDKVG